MNYFLVTYRYKTKAMFRKGRWMTQDLVFGAGSLESALRAAKAHGEQIFGRRSWQIISCRPEGSRQA